MSEGIDGYIYINTCRNPKKNIYSLFKEEVVWIKNTVVQIHRINNLIIGFFLVGLSSFIGIIF